MEIPVETLFPFAIQFLAECERSKTWRTLTLDYRATCGYTGPGIALILQLFKTHGIYNESSLDGYFHRTLQPPPEGYPLGKYLAQKREARQHFINAINETIGNFFDLAGECPDTGVTAGITGILGELEAKRAMADDALSEKIKRVEPGDFTEQDGIHLLSFTFPARPCETFHHSTLVVQPLQETCYLFDSWVNNDEMVCRPLTVRQHDYRDTMRALTLLNNNDDPISVQDAATIFTELFHAPRTIAAKFETYGTPSVHTVSPSYIDHIFHQCIARITSGAHSSFGGKSKRRAKRLKKSRKRKN